MSFVRCFAGAAVAAALAAAPVAAQPASPALQTFKAKQAELKSRFADAAKGVVPRIADPADGPLMQAALDSGSLSLVDFSDLEKGFEVCEPGAVASQVYLTVGIADTDGALTNPTREQTAVMARNSVTYRDEISLALAFTIDCFGRMMPPLADYWARLDKAGRDDGRPGLVMVRDGTTSIYEGGIGMLSEAKYSPQNKELVLGALTRNASAYAAVMTPAQRGRVVAAVDRFSAQTPADMRPRLAQLRAIFAQAACTGLCAA